MFDSLPIEDEHKIDLFEPATIVFFIMAAISDFCFFGMIGLAIPAVGPAIAEFVLGAHYFFGLVILLVFWRKTKGFSAKMYLVTCWLFPLPLLSAGLAFAVIMSNKYSAIAFEIGEAVVTQVAIQVAAIGTGGGAEALEGGALAAEGLEAGAIAAEGAEAVGATALEGAADLGSAAAEAGVEGAAEGAAEGATAAPEGAGVDLEPDIEKNPLDIEERKLLEESPEEELPDETEEEEPAKETREQKIKKQMEEVRDIIKRASQRKEDEEDEDQNEDENEDVETDAQPPSNVVNIDDYRRRQQQDADDSASDSRSGRKAA